MSFVRPLPHLGAPFIWSAEPKDDWGQLELLCGWPEQRDYELIRPMVLFGSPASERAKETGAATSKSPTMT